MSWTYTFFASIIEGLTEFLPISSTGHLIILNHLLKIQHSDLVSSFDIFIQLGAILAVINLYYQELIKKPKVLLNLLVSFIPTALVGLILYPFIKRYLLNNLPITVTALFLGGILIFFLPQKNSNSKNLGYWDYFKIGLFQSLSIIPGTSRALMSVVGGLFTGLNTADSIKYSFLLAIPTIGAATALDIIKNKDLLLQSVPHNLSFFLVGFLLSFVTAKFCVNFFLNYIKNKPLTFFGYYRLLLAFLIGITFFLPF